MLLTKSLKTLALTIAFTTTTSALAQTTELVVSTQTENGVEFSFIDVDSNQVKAEIAALEAQDDVIYAGVAARIPNDPLFSKQTFWDERTEEKPTLSDIAKARQLGYPKYRPRIGVLDRGFVKPEYYPDLNPVIEYSFYDLREDNYNPTAWNTEEMGDCDGDTGHGASVAGIIGATQDDVNISGIVDADLYLARVGDCDKAGMTNEIDWLSQRDVEEFWLPSDFVFPEDKKVPAKVDFINISMGAWTRLGCGNPWNEGVFKRIRENDVVVIAAAGNDNIDVGEVTSVHDENGDRVGFENLTDHIYPAACDHVISVAALQPDNLDKMDYSNYGKNIDIAAVGEKVYSFDYADGGETLTGDFRGTSAAAPIVTGILGLAKSYAPSVPNYTLVHLMKETAKTLKDAVECAKLGCGAGLIDADNLVSAAMKFDMGEMGVIKPALAEGEVCDVQAYEMIDGVLERLCSTYQVELTRLVQDESLDIVYNVISVSTDADLTFENRLSTLYKGRQSVFMASESDIDTQAVKYGYYTCKEGVCNTDYVYPIKVSSEKSAQCDA